MIYNSKEVLHDLVAMTTEHLNYAKQLQNISESQVQYKATPTTWSVLECLEHLNRYAEFYNTEIDRRIQRSTLPFSDTFKSSYLGNKFANEMLPHAQMKTMNTFKSKNPNASALHKEQVLQNFIALQETLLALLQVANSKNLDKIKTATTLPLLKFKLGDTFRFVIHHNERHIVQAKRILHSL